jgi:excisionase family DNA binding protein
MATLLKVTEAAEELNVSRAKAWQWIRDGRLPAVKIDGILRVRRSDLDTFVAGLSQRPASTASR